MERIIKVYETTDKYRAPQAPKMQNVAPQAPHLSFTRGKEEIENYIKRYKLGKKKGEEEGHASASPFALLRSRSDSLCSVEPARATPYKLST